MKKYFIVTALLVVGALFLAGCGTTPKNNDAAERLKSNSNKAITELESEIKSTTKLQSSSSPKYIVPTQVAASQPELYLPLLKKKRVGVVVNQTSVVYQNVAADVQQSSQTHLVDFLKKNKIDVQYIFAPEHGFRGNHDAGELVKSSKDSQTGIEIVSIYGKNKKPSDDIMAELDVILFDIQDVGVRFYTYISSMHYMMQAAAENNVEFVVLDRPNPNIQFVDGPILDNKFRSFVGMHPIPLSHGMTVGEIAKMIVGENWLTIRSQKPDDYQYQLNLTVVPVKGYNRIDLYNLPIAPSPNLPNAQSIQLYASLCLFEATQVSVGRGTDFPFQMLGHDKHFIGDFSFTPRSIKGASSNPKFKGREVKGQDLRQADIKGFDLSLLLAWYKQHQDGNQNEHSTPFFTRAAFMDNLSGTDELRKAIEAGSSQTDIEQSWQPALNQFLVERKPYLLYQ